MDSDIALAVLNLDGNHIIEYGGQSDRYPETLLSRVTDPISRENAYPLTGPDKVFDLLDGRHRILGREADDQFIPIPVHSKTFDHGKRIIDHQRTAGLLGFLLHPGRIGGSIRSDNLQKIHTIRISQCIKGIDLISPLLP